MASSDEIQCSLLAPDAVATVFRLLSLRTYADLCDADFVFTIWSLSWETLISAVPVSVTKHSRNALVNVGEISSLSAPTGLYHVTDPSWHVSLALRTPGGPSKSSLKDRR